MVWAGVMTLPGRLPSVAIIELFRPIRTDLIRFKGDRLDMHNTLI